MSKGDFNTSSSAVPAPLGAVLDDAGVTFSLFSANATRIELCLFAEDGAETSRVSLARGAEDIWQAHVAGIKPGQLYAYRVDGPHDPAHGHYFDFNRLLLDPYAREIVGDNKARVAAPLPAISKPLQTPWDKTVIYEMHAKGFTVADPALPEDLRGTYAGLGHAATTEYLKKLGVTAVELLPVHEKRDEDKLVENGLKNYWGYNTIGFFSVEQDYMKTGKREEFRQMVDNLHAAGIEVILDVVYNHTGEGGPHNTTYSFRGIDNASYYKLDPQDNSKYLDNTGCGNTLDIGQPAVRRLVLDSLRCWATEFGVDGFRFDLAPVLGRDGYDFNAQGEFFKEIAADPVLSKLKLIAEPWDLGSNGYQLGHFANDWHEWNDKFRNDVRAFWRGDEDMIRALATRLAGSSPEFNHYGRGPLETLNMVACHDGFTLEDLVTYTAKRNEANGENNRDGNDQNFSANYGTEGQTEDPGIIEMRERQKRNMLATLFLSQGVPQLLAGDEFGNSQFGNNNAYCQDSHIGWLKRDEINPEGHALTGFVQKLIEFRQAHDFLQHRDFLHGNPSADGQSRDLAWVNTGGQPQTDADWNYKDNKCLGMMLDESVITGKPDGEKLLMVFNAAANDVSFNLPAVRGDNSWQRVLDTSDPGLDGAAPAVSGTYNVPYRSVVVFSQKPKI